MKGHTAINDIVYMMNYLKKVTTKDYLESIITKHQDDSSKIKDRINQLVDKMVEIEEDIFQKNEEKYRIEAEERKQQFLKKKDKLLSLKVIQPTHIPSFSISKSISPSQFHSKHVFDDSQLNVIFQSMDILKKWSEKQSYSVLFDSMFDGDGLCGTLKDTVIGKDNLYFISFDGDNDIFGGFLRTQIKKSDSFIYDPNAFVFSLMRNGKITRKRYFIHQKFSRKAFWLNTNGDWLYLFGGGIHYDICVYHVGNEGSHCHPHCFNYFNEKNPLSDKICPHWFSVQRIVVLQMK